MSEAERLRARAAHYRRLRTLIVDDRARDALDQLAEEFERQADALDQGKSVSKGESSN